MTLTWPGVWPTVGSRLISAPIEMLYTPGAVLLGLVHTFLPFAILPIEASAEALDPALVEASGDLGAGPMRTFGRVVLPLLRPAMGEADDLRWAGHRRHYVVATLMGLLIGAYDGLVGPGTGAFLVFALCVVDQGHRWLDQIGQISDLAGMVHAQFHHRNTLFGAQAQDRERQADVVVEVALRGEITALAAVSAQAK